MNVIEVSYFVTFSDDLNFVCQFFFFLIIQATLGPGSSKERSIIQCSVGHKSPIFLCSLIPNKIESCPLNLEFEEDDLVAFSVIGPQSIHLSGYFVADEGRVIRDDYESYPFYKILTTVINLLFLERSSIFNMKLRILFGLIFSVWFVCHFLTTMQSDSFGEDIAETDTEDSSEYDTGDEYDDEFIDDDDDEYPEMYPTSPVPKSGGNLKILWIFYYTICLTFFPRCFISFLTFFKVMYAV